MGLFDVIKKKFAEMKEAERKRQEEVRRKQEEEQEEKRRKEEEEKKKREEARRFNPEDKPTEWFVSADGLETFGQYITIQNYFLEEEAKRVKETKYPQYDLDVVISVVYPNAKLPSAFFKHFVNSISAQPLKYVGPTDLLTSILGILAKPFQLDDDGEPQACDPALPPEVLLSVEKNPVLNYITNFNCFELADDEKGAWKDKWLLYSCIMNWLAVYACDADILAKNPWVFSGEVYFNDVGRARKLKGFLKKCIELADDKSKAYFEKEYEKCE